MNSISKAFYGGVLIVVVVVMGIIGMVYYSPVTSLTSRGKSNDVDKASPTTAVTSIVEMGKVGNKTMLYYVEVRFKGYYGSTPLWVAVNEESGAVAIK